MTRSQMLAARTSARTRLVGLAGALIAALAVCSSAAADSPIVAPPAASACVSGASGAAAIACANIQRAANGIPPIIEEADVDASSWCPNEDDESQGVGDWRDMSGMVDAWSAASSPWDNAPLHQQDLYNPMLQQAGDSRTQGQECWGALPATSEQDPTTPTFFTYISERGNGSVPGSETTAEYPFTPQSLVGLGTETTGPDIIVYATGFPDETLWASGPMAVTAWSITAASGQSVPDVRMVDEATGAQAGYPGYVDGDSAFIIPAKPLNPGPYTGSVTWQGPDGTVGTQQFAFTVQGDSGSSTGSPQTGSPQAGRSQTPRSRKGNRVTERVTALGHGVVLVRMTSTDPVAKLTAARRGGHRTLIFRYSSLRARTVRKHLARGWWRLCLSSGGDRIYKAASACRTARSR